MTLEEVEEKIAAAAKEGLTKLNLDGDQLTTVPESIGKLQNLQTLSLFNNQLTTVPENIGNLQNLKEFYLHNNQLIAIPESVAKLQNLQRLDLSRNKLTHIPRQLFDLNLKIIMNATQNINGLNLGENPLESPPLEIAEQGLEAVRDYFKQLEGDTVQLFEAKLLIVGQGGVGKTFLLNRLLHDKTPDTVSTEGIDIHKWRFKTKQTDKFQANFWDFGGQAIYHATHQFFLTKRSLYLFVWEARLDDDISSFDYWLNTIKVLSGDSPVLVIQNKIEARKKTLDQTYWTTLFTNIVEFHDVSAKEGIGTEALGNAIVREIEKLPHIGDKLPKKWVDIRTDLEALDANYIPYADYQDICKKYNMDDVQINRLSQYYHDLGVFLRFADSPILRDTVFLKPDWATNAVYKVLDNEEVQESHGRFSFNDLKKIWQNKTLYPAAIHGNLLELMKSFELCFELPQTNEYIIPERLKPDKPDLGWDYADNLRFKYEYDFMPAGIITRFIVSTHDLIGHNLYWKGGLILTFDGAKALVVKTRSRVIEIWIKEGDKRALLSIVRRELDRINRSFSNLTVNQMVKCICDECAKSTKPHFFTYEQLLKFRTKNLLTMQCSKSGDHVSIELLLGGIETTKQSENKAAQIAHVHGNVYVTHGDATFNKIEVQQTITNIKQVIEKSTAIEPAAKKKFLEHVDNIFKEFSKEGAKAGAKLGYDALKEYMISEGIPKALSRAVKVASGGWLG